MRDDEQPILDVGRLHHAEDGRTVACHFCAREFGHLGNHVKRSHGMTADYYRERCGLQATTGLISLRLAEMRRVRMLQIPEMNDPERGRAILSALTPLQRRINNQAKRYSIEEQGHRRTNPLRHVAVEAMRRVSQRNSAYRRSIQPPLICQHCQRLYLRHTVKGRLAYCSRECYTAMQRGKNAPGLQMGQRMIAERAAARLVQPCRGCGRPIGEQLTTVVPTRQNHLRRGVCSPACQAVAYPLQLIRTPDGRIHGRRPLIEVSI